MSGDVRLQASLAAGPLHTVETVSGDLSVEATTGVTVDVRRGMDFNREGSSGLVTGDGAAQLRFRTLSGDCHVEGARRVDRPGWRDRKFERRIERHAGRLARRMSPEEMGFTGMPTMPPMPPMRPMHGNPMPPMPGDPMPATSSAPPAPESAAVDQLEVLRALERGEIDVEEASRRLQ